MFSNSSGMAFTAMLVLALTAPASGQTVLALQERNDSEASLLDRPARLTVTDVGLDVALSRLSETSGVVVAFSPSLIDGVAGNVECHCADATVATALDHLLAGTLFRYGIVDGQVVLTPIAAAPTNPGVLTGAARFASLDSGRGRSLLDRLLTVVTPILQGTITGRVTSLESGDALGGVTVSLQNTSFGTLTDEDGRFRLEEIPAGAYTLVATSIGYREQTRAITVRADEALAVNFALGTQAVLMDEIIVAGTVVGTRRRASPVPVTVLTEGEIHTPARTRIDQLFRGNTPGIIGLEEHPSQGGAYIFVRGRASLDVNNLIKVYVDGVEMPSSTLISSMDLQNIERIELLRGPQATTIYGSNAAGGVLLVFTKKGSRGGPRLTGAASFGSLASDYTTDSPMMMEHRVNLSGGDAGFGYSIGGSYSSIGEWIEQGDTRKVAFNGTGTFTQGPLRFSLTSMYTNRLIGITNPPGADVLVPVIPGYGMPNNTDATATMQLLGASATYTPTDRWETSVNIGWNGITNRNRQYEPQGAFPGDSTYGTSLQGFDQLSARLHSTMRAQPSAGVTSTTTVGAEFSRGSSEYFQVDLFSPQTEFQTPTGVAYVSPNTVTENQGYFLQEVVGFNDRLFLTGAVRAEHNSNFGENREWLWAPRAGLSYVIENESGLAFKPRASYGKSLRPPEPGEAGGSISANYVQRANPDLRPEVQRGFDVGFDLGLNHGMVRLEATYFDQVSEDLIDLAIFSLADPAAGVPNVFQYQNIGEVSNRGVELGLQATVGRFDVATSYTYALSEVNSLSDEYMGDLERGDQLIYAPKQTAGGTLGLNLPSPIASGSGKSTRLEFGATYVGTRQTEDQIGLIACLYGLQECVDDSPGYRDYWVELESFVKLRLGVTQPVRHNVDLFLNIDNLTNRQEGEFFIYNPSRGRTILIGATFGN